LRCVALRCFHNQNRQLHADYSYDVITCKNNRLCVMLLK